MRATAIRTFVSMFVVGMGAHIAAPSADAQTQQSAYSAMASVDQYLIPNRATEIALARSAAPSSISSGAEVMVLDRKGYSTAVKGTNGFVCLVERSWDAPSNDRQFWNPKIRGPNCFNPAAARTYLPIVFLKTQLLLAGKSKAEVMHTIASELDTKKLPALESGAMCYMLSKRQYVNDNGKAWHPHLMFFVPGNSADGWGANRDDGPVLATNDPDDRLTVMLLTVSHGSDGTAADKM